MTKTFFLYMSIKRKPSVTFAVAGNMGGQNVKLFCGWENRGGLPPQHFYALVHKPVNQ